jgi:cytochrome c-type biogenesis protein CcmH/NrfF
VTSLTGATIRLWIATAAVIVLVVVVWKIIDYRMQPPPPPSGEVIGEVKGEK